MFLTPPLAHTRCCLCRATGIAVVTMASFFGPHADALADGGICTVTVSRVLPAGAGPGVDDVSMCSAKDGKVDVSAVFKAELESTHHNPEAILENESLEWSIVSATLAGFALPPATPPAPVDVAAKFSLNPKNGETTTLTGKGLDQVGDNTVTIKVKAHCEWTVQGKKETADSEATAAIVFHVDCCGVEVELVPEDDFAGRSLERVGLGEPGMVRAIAPAGGNLAELRPLTWSIKSGDEFVSLANLNTDAGTADFTASKKAGTAVLELTDKRRCKTRLEIAVVAPSAVYHRYFADHEVSGVADGKVSYGLLNHVHFRPTDVSFHWIQTGEGEDPKAESTGELAEVFGEKAHEENGPYAMTKGHAAMGSRWVPPDNIVAAGLKIGGDEGLFIWDIPQQYLDDTQKRIPIMNLQDRIDFDGDKKIRIRKGGVDKTGP